MSQAKFLILTLSLVLAIDRVNVSQSKDEAMHLLREVSETYKDLRSYHFEAVLTTEAKAQGIEQKIEMPLVVAAVLPDKVRVEIKDAKAGMLTISDGRTTWVYMDRLKQYTRKEVEPLDTRSGENGRRPESLPGPTFARFTDGYGLLADEAQEATILREEPLEVEGKKIDCYVVNVKGRESDRPEEMETPVRLLWIDKTRHLVLQETSEATMNHALLGHLIQTRRTTTFTLATVNEPLPDTLFAFSPPLGAAEVEKFSLQELQRRSGLGQEAPDFRLKDLLGKEFHLKSLRGKVVLLEFWASWCGPCRIEMPMVEKLHRNFKDQGLTVLGINDEEPEVALDFLQDKDLTFPMLVDANQEVLGSYRVSAIPTIVLIDREGKIVRRDVGLRDEEDLRVALKKVGIE